MKERGPGDTAKGQFGEPGRTAQNREETREICSGGLQNWIKTFQMNRAQGIRRTREEPFKTGLRDEGLGKDRIRRNKRNEKNRKF